MTDPSTSAMPPSGSGFGTDAGADAGTDAGIAAATGAETVVGTDTGQSVSVVLPPVLAALAGDRKQLQLPVPAMATVADVLDTLGRDNPVLNRRLRDETGAVRRYVNLFVDGEDVRDLDGASTEIRPGQELFIIQSVAGG